MRKIGNIEKADLARKFEDTLLAEGIECKTTSLDDGSYGIWVLDDDDIEVGSELLIQFQNNPGDEKFSRQVEAKAVRDQQKALEKSFQKHDRNLNNEFAKNQGFRGAPLTYVLIGVSILVAFLSNMGENYGILQRLFITKAMVMGDQPWADTSLGEIRSGEVWRLFTPIFIHFGLLHLVFNMWWLKDLGGLIERRHKAIYLGALVLFIAIVSNLCEFYFSFPDIEAKPYSAFGGMSGVVYGLFGFLWIRGKVDPNYGLRINSQVVALMLVWLVVCMLGFMPIANVAHVVGLFMGIGWALLSAPRQA